MKSQTDGEGDREHKTGVLARAAVSLFILFHLIAIVAHALPGRGRDWLTGALDSYYRATGLVQNWQMFAPHPPTSNTDLDARITFEDGSVVLWAFPSPSSFPPFSSTPKDRLQKWESLTAGEKRWITWPDTSRFVARLHYRDDRRPRIVELRRRLRDIPPPGHPPFRQAPPHAFMKTFYTYYVQPGDLY